MVDLKGLGQTFSFPTFVIHVEFKVEMESLSVEVKVLEFQF